MIEPQRVPSKENFAYGIRRLLDVLTLPYYLLRWRWDEWRWEKEVQRIAQEPCDVEHVSSAIGTLRRALERAGQSGHVLIDIAPEPSLYVRISPGQEKRVSLFCTYGLSEKERERFINRLYRDPLINNGLSVLAAIDNTAYAFSQAIELNGTNDTPTLH